MITNQLKDLARRFSEALMQWRGPRRRAQEIKSGSRARGYLAVVGVLVLAFSLAAAVGPNPAPPSQQVREQNLDENGNIRVHEQGTADVNVTNARLDVSGTVRATIPPVTTTFWHPFVLEPGFPSQQMSFPTINASAIHVQLGDFDTETRVFFKSPLVVTGFGQGLFFLRAEPDHKGDLITFTQPVPINGVEVHCTQNVLGCSALVSVVGVPMATP